MTAVHRVFMGSALCALAWFAQAQEGAARAGAILDDDAKVLVDTARMEVYWQTPLPLAQSLCLQEQLGTPGLQAVAGDAAVTDRMADRLRRAWERCALTPDEAPDVRLVREARTRYQATLLRLQGPEQQLRLCRQEPEGTQRALSCLQRALGRAPSETERQWLLALAPKRP
jgi:hypothetical protein